MSRHGQAPRAQDRSAPASADSEFLGERLRSLRQQQGLSLRGLAKKMGVTATALHYWESGQRNPNREHLQSFRAALQLANSELIESTETTAHSGSSMSVLNSLVTDASCQSLDLAEVVASCKEHIAAAAGVTAEKVHIVVEF